MGRHFEAAFLERFNYSDFRLLLSKRTACLPLYVVLNSLASTTGADYYNDGLTATAVALVLTGRRASSAHIVA